MIIDLEIKSKVDNLFREIGGRPADIVENPVTGSTWVKGHDSEEQPKLEAYRALLARKRFVDENSADASSLPRLPLTYGEREGQKRGGIPHIQAWYAESLLRLNYDMDVHPPFEDYARGVMASPNIPDVIKQDLELNRRFPPKPLDGLGQGLVWRGD